MSFMGLLASPFDEKQLLCVNGSILLPIVAFGTAKPNMKLIAAVKSQSDLHRVPLV